MRRDGMEDFEDVEDAEEKRVERKGTSKPSRNELRSMVLAAAVLVYGAVNRDVPVCFLAVAFLLFESRYFAETMCGPYGRTISGILQGFSITLFFGALLLIFF